MTRATGAGALDPPRSRSSHVQNVERGEPVRVRHHEIDRLVPLAPKYVLLLAGAIAITLALYEVLVRRTNATRFLFGLKPKPRATRVDPAR